MTGTYVLGDWGTSRLRLYRMSCGQVVEARDGPGIGHLSGPAAAVLADALSTWSPSNEVVLCGMASSRNGLIELPYVRAPANVTEWVRAARRARVDRFEVLLATGIQCGDEVDGFDVMRGEEAQIFGAARLYPELQRGKQWLVLPGTHSKWVELDDGAVVRFRTAVTGELYSLLMQHSVLLERGAPIARGADFDAGFERGLERGRAANVSLLSVLFQARTARLLQSRSPQWAAGFLSGVLIAHELASLSGSFACRSPTIIGDAELLELYQRAFDAAGCVARVIDGVAAALSGLQLLHELHDRTPST